MLRIDGPPQFRAAGELLTPQCHSLTIEGESWREGALITQIECYGGVVDVKPENARWRMNTTQANVLALGSLGLSNPQIVKAIDSDICTVANAKKALSDRVYREGGAPFYGFSGCIYPYVKREALQISHQQSEPGHFPEHITEGIRNWIDGRSLHSVARRHGMSPRTLDEELSGFRKEQGIPGAQRTGFILFSFMKGIWPSIQ